MESCGCDDLELAFLKLSQMQENEKEIEVLGKLNIKLTILINKFGKKFVTNTFFFVFRILINLLEPLLILYSLKKMIELYPKLSLPALCIKI